MCSKYELNEKCQSGTKNVKQNFATIKKIFAKNVNHGIAHSIKSDECFPQYKSSVYEVTWYANSSSECKLWKVYIGSVQKM